MMLKMVVRIERASPEPFAGEDCMGAERFAHMRGRNLPILGDWLTRCIRRLYAAMNSVTRSKLDLYMKCRA